MDQEFYVKILDEKSLNVNKYNGDDWQLQFEIDLKHTSKLAREFLKTKNLMFIKWQPYSLDLNTLEHFCSMLIQELDKDDICYRTDKKIMKKLGKN